MVDAAKIRVCALVDIYVTSWSGCLDLSLPLRQTGVCGAQQNQPQDPGAKNEPGASSVYALAGTAKSGPPVHRAHSLQPTANSETEAPGFLGV